MCACGCVCVRNLINPHNSTASKRAREVAAERSDSCVPEIPRSGVQENEKGLVSTEDPKLRLSSYTLRCADHVTTDEDNDASMAMDNMVFKLVHDDDVDGDDWA